MQNMIPPWRRALALLVVISSCILAACAPVDLSVAPAALLAQAGQEASAAGMVPYEGRGDSFTLAGFARSGAGSTLVVYIEGDGRAWSSRTRPSADPTPREPFTLRLAVRDPAPKLLYVARPCQYLARQQAPGVCQPELWTSSRYGPEVVKSLSLALDQAKRDLGADRLSLVGYSGGGVLALLLAAVRNDVLDVLTVGANLDIRAWASFHGVSELYGSLNPAEKGEILAGIWQTHLVGKGDRICPPWLCEVFLDKIGHPARARCILIEGADHWKGIEPLWDQILFEHRRFTGSR